MGLDGIDEAGDQQVAGRIGSSEETGDPLIGQSSIPLVAGQKRGVNESALDLAAIENIFLEETVESGHESGVGERPGERAGDVADVALALRPKNLHDLKLQGPEGA